MEHGGNFRCHETVHFDESAEYGSDVWLQTQGRPNQLMQIMERLGVFDPARLDQLAPVYRTRGSKSACPLMPACLC